MIEMGVGEIDMNHALVLHLKGTWNFLCFLDVFKSCIFIQN